jgi:hypothetical protein
MYRTAEGGGFLVPATARCFGFELALSLRRFVIIADYKSETDRTMAKESSLFKFLRPFVASSFTRARAVYLFEALLLVQHTQAFRLSLHHYRT